VNVAQSQSKFKIKQDTVDAPSASLIPVFNHVKQMVESLQLFTELEIDILPLLTYARKFRMFQNVIVFGTGGSCLSGKMYANFKTIFGPKMHFIDNVDSYEWTELFRDIDPKTTGVIAISKSGNTTETLCQTLMAIEMWNGLPYFDHFLFITDQTENAIREIAKHYGITCLDHPLNIGGRFSGFSVVGLLPALIAGIDVKEIVAGAQNIVATFLEKGPSTANEILNGAFLQNDLFSKGKNIFVMFCYSNRLRPFAEWHRQLLAESLGKKDGGDVENSKRYGTTPVIAMGTIDQHSQLQLYIDGPQDKFFTFIFVGDHPQTKPIKINGAINKILSVIDGCTMAELMNAHQQATLHALVHNDIPTRSIFVPKLNEYAVGQLMMFSILETLALASIWQIDPFNQPGVKFAKDRVIELIQD
jgi:glucose-6-phosphate isomerase